MDNRITEENINEAPQLQPTPDVPQESISLPPVVDNTQPPEVQPVPPTPVVPVQPGELTVDQKLAQIDQKLAQMQALSDQMTAQALKADQVFKSKVTVQDQAAYEDKVKKQKAYYDSQPKVKIMVPLDGNEKRGSSLPVTVNGYRVNVPKGIYVDVPQGIAEIIMESLDQTQAADSGNEFNLMNADKERKDALS